MNKQMSLSEWLRACDEGLWKNPSFENMVEAGWYDWFCDDDDLQSELELMVPFIREIAKSPRLDPARYRILLKNNCPLYGELYTDFRLTEIDGDQHYCVVPSSGHTGTAGQSEVWYTDDYANFGCHCSGTWEDILEHMKCTTKKEKRWRGEPWDTHPEYPVCDWRHEVSEDSTRLGYVEWVNAQLEFEEVENE